MPAVTFKLRSAATLRPAALAACLRHNHPRIGRIVMGRGRDAADVAMSSAFGVANLARFEVVTQEQVQP